MGAARGLLLHGPATCAQTGRSSKPRQTQSWPSPPNNSPCQHFQRAWHSSFKSKVISSGLWIQTHWLSFSAPIHSSSASVLVGTSVWPMALKNVLLAISSISLT
ncbi:unnamed protein product, partial [Heterosigma akashiwo]